VALPGGRFEKTDKDLFDTAVRETKEETGVSLSATLIGVLDDLTPRSPTLPPVIVRPFVFSMAQRPALLLNEELTGIHWFRLDDLARSACEAVVGHRRESGEGGRLRARARLRHLGHDAPDSGRIPGAGFGRPKDPGARGAGEVPFLR